jgi:rRNA maturation endonuclease Nob1
MRMNNGVCPKCGSKLTTAMESESSSNGVKTVKYVSRCRGCNEVNIIEEVIIRRQGNYLEILLKK